MNITTDGEVSFQTQTGRTAVFVSGDLGSAMVSIGYTDPASNFVAFEGAEEVKVGKQYLIRHGTQVDPVIKTVGADGGTNFYVTTSACHS